jgi:hypothetical protein
VIFSGGGWRAQLPVEYGKGCFLTAPPPAKMQIMPFASINAITFFLSVNRIGNSANYRSIRDLSKGVFHFS